MVRRRGDGSAAPQGIADAFVSVLGVRSPVGRDRGEAAGHGLHQREVPALSAPGRNVAVRRPVEGAELGVRELPVQDEGDPASLLGELEPPDLVDDSDRRVAIGDLAEQPDRLASRKRLVEGLEQQLRRLSRPPLEAGEEDEVAERVRIPRDVWMEIVRVDSERNHEDRLLQPGLQETAAVELRRDPDLVHLGSLADPLLR